LLHDGALLGDDESPALVIADIENRHGPITHLANCAGPLQNADPPNILPIRVWDRMINICLRGT
jgi:NAD(P)-dependent dehydrogenase (short-subunit alcohol dehydrogenase family)